MARLLHVSTVLLLVLCSTTFAIALPVLQASPSVLSYSLDEVTLTWKGIDNPTTNDYINIYSPPENLQYVGYVSVMRSDTWSTGSGAVSFPLVNSRTDYSFSYFRNGSNLAAAVSNRVSFQNPNEPLQIHLQLTSDPTQMIIMWTIRDSLPSFVNYSVDSGNLYNNVKANATTYTIRDMCNAPANTTAAFRLPGYIYSALLQNLSPATLYHYRVGSSAGYSEELYFVSSPGIGKSKEVEVILYGDLGVRVPFDIPQEQQYEAHGTSYWINQQLDKDTTRPSMILHIGDISYARGWAYLWEWFMSEIQTAASRVPYMVSCGNHDYDFIAQPFLPPWGDYDNDSGGECAVPYNTRFIMPGQAQNRNYWYSFEYGPIHYCVMSAELNFTKGSPQWNWVKQDLASVNREVTPWVIFGGHRPMYTSADSGETLIQQAIQDAYEPFFVEYKVNLAIWGHIHDYERTCGMTNFTCAKSDNDATVHVVIGMAGNDSQNQWIPLYPGDDHYVQPDWIVFRSMNYGYTSLYANATHLNLKYFDNTRGDVHDSLWLQQPQ